MISGNTICQQQNRDGKKWSKQMPKTEIRCKLCGEDGNAWSILARVRAALRKGGRADLVEPFTNEATSGDYNHLLVTAMDYIVEGSEEDEEDNYPFAEDEDEDE